MALKQKKTQAQRDEELARRYEKKDPRLAALLRIPQEVRTADQELAVTVLLMSWDRREGKYTPTVFAP